MLLPSAASTSRLHRQRRQLGWCHARFLLFVVVSGSGFMMLLHLLLSLTTASCLVNASCFKGFHSPYSFDAHLAHHPQWMGDIPDASNLTSLSIPGTHDTMTFDIKKFSLQCQNWNLSTQLNAGLRYIDIRARLQNDMLHVFHADEPTGHSYQEVLTTLFAFLKTNPSEAIIMRLKEEGPPLGSNSRSFQDAFNWARLNSSVTGKDSLKHMYIYNDTALPLPTLGMLRSKVFILQNWIDRSSEQTYGIRWEGPQMSLEDKWIIPDAAHLEDKWQAIRDALEKVNQDTLDNGRIYLAHVSASVGVLPIEAAAGTKNSTYPEGMNDKTSKWLNRHVQGGERTGVVIFDYPGKKSIEAVLRWNQRLVNRTART